MSGTIHGARMLKSTSSHTDTINALPIGAITAWMGNETPEDFLPFEGQMISIPDYPEFAHTVWCGEAHNETADFFYRTADAKGAMRMATGEYLKMPDGSKYFMRGRDDAGEVHPYQYQDWAIENIKGEFLAQNGYATIDGSSGIATGAFKKGSISNQRVIDYTSSIYTGGALLFDAAEAVKTDTETRPMNFPVKWIIRAANSTVRTDGVDIVSLKAKVDGLEALIEGVTHGTGVPVGSIIEWGGRADSIPPGYMNITTDTIQAVLVETYPGFANAAWCGEAYNADADFFYRCDQVDGTGRNNTGQYIVLPMASKYFTRGRDDAGEVHPYQYQKGTLISAGGNYSDGGSGLNYGVANSSASVIARIQEDIGSDRIKVADYPYGARVYAAGQVQAVTGMHNGLGSTRPMNFPVLYLIKLFDAVSNPAMLDIQKLIEQAANNAVPLGMVAGVQSREAPPGWIALNDTSETFLPVDAVPQFAAVYWCGAAYNDTADFAYRCDNPDGTGRNIDGAYIALMAAGKRFMRGRDATGVVHPYRYQEDAIRNITGAVGLSQITGTPTFGFGTQSSGAFGNSTALGKEERSGFGYMHSSSLSVKSFPVPYLDASLQVPTAEENRPANFPVIWCIKVAGRVASQGLIDATKLLNHCAALSKRVDMLEKQKADQSAVFGIGQAWHHLLTERSAVTDYVNTTGKPILVIVGALANATGSVEVTLYVDGMRVNQMHNYSSGPGYSDTAFAIVPAGAAYRAAIDSSVGAASLNLWTEFR